MDGSNPVLYVVACGGYPAQDLPRFAQWAQTEGWRVCVVATPKGREFLDTAALQQLTGYPVRHDYKHPDDPDVLPPANAMLVAPATFNTVNKLAAGISDTLALGLVNEAIGLGIPVIAAPWPNKALATRRPFRESVERLRAEGVRFVLDDENLPEPASGRPGAAAFPWQPIHAQIISVRQELSR
ncbi:flavoprotein [Streptomyces albipurpureus]|uniref:Flavoprotein n=1 Tax=Streptomyces albipurpureus TaxID=2897419 RepID=A0ABT0UXI6_9ACTN|nr:flavoprotein [Streptomyces sp. CWNU-1]MCM2393166.1 flavoprotein [Streptomyces sp. CWNU-1]